MITLAFDTCLDKMYAAIKKDGKILSSRVIENHDNKYHSAFLISTLQEIIKENNLKPQDIDLIATDIGPGSFTGIRACVTVARVMAQQLNCDAVGISSLEILAESAAHFAPLVKGGRTACGGGILTALDARKNSAYLYQDGEIKGAVKLEEIQEIIKSGKYEVLTDDKLQPLLGGISYQQCELPIGETIADLAERDGQETNWRKLKPLYIQPPPGNFI